MRIALWTVLLAAIVQPAIAAPMVHFTDIIADDSRTGFAGFEGAPSTVNVAGGVSYLGFSGGQFDELWLSATNGRPAAPNSGTAQALQIDSIEGDP